MKIILIGSPLSSIVGEMHRWHYHVHCFALLSYETNRFNVAMGLYSNISQNMVKLGKYISYTLSCKSCGASLFLPSFDIICDLLLKRFTATRNLFVKFFAVFAVQVKVGGNERVATGVLIPFHTNFWKLHASWCKGKTKNLTLSRLSVKFTHHILILGIITCHAFTLCHPLIRGK